MGHLIIDCSFLLTILVILIFFYFRQKKCKKISNDFLQIFSKNVDFITNLYEKLEVSNLKNNIQLSAYFQIILKISKADYITFFKYDYTQNHVVKLDFITSMDYNGTIIQNSILDQLPITSNILLLDIIKSDDKDIYFITDSQVKERNNVVYDVLEKREIKKVYYHNIYKQNRELPIGFIAISYKDENDIIIDSDKTEIFRLIEKMKSYL